jgi:hypothetical protein
MLQEKEVKIFLMTVTDNSVLDSYIFYWPLMSCYTHFSKPNNNSGFIYLFDYTSYFWFKATFQADFISHIPKLGNQYSYHDRFIVLGCAQYKHKHPQNYTMRQNEQMNVLKQCMKLSFAFKKVHILKYTVRSFMICPPHQTLFKWSNKEDWDKQGM